MRSHDDNAVSVIIPVYNCEKYISKCIDSIRAQTFSNFELLLILDGNVDSSPMICKEYAQMDKRIIIFEQENQGVSAARNKGLDNATGKYVLFVDSDDWLEPDCLDKLVITAESSKCDIVICGFYVEKKNSSESFGFFSFEEHTFFKEDAFFLSKNCLIGDCNNHRRPPVLVGNPWAKLYRRRLIEAHGLRFPYGVQFGEDVIFNLRTFWHSERTVLIPNHLYHYSLRDDSISRSYNPKMCELSERICESAWIFGKTICDSKWEIVCKDRWVLALFDIVKYQFIPSMCPLSRSEKIRRIKVLSESEDAPYKRVMRARKSFLVGKTRAFWYLLRLRLYWVIYLYCELKYR